MSKKRTPPKYPTPLDVWTTYGDDTFYAGRVEKASYVPGWFKMEKEDGYVNLNPTYNTNKDGEPFATSQAAVEIQDELWSKERPQPRDYSHIEVPPPRERPPAAVGVIAPKSVSHQSMRMRAIKAATIAVRREFPDFPLSSVKFTHVLTKDLSAWVFSVGFALGEPEKDVIASARVELLLDGSGKNNVTEVILVAQGITRADAVHR